MAKGMNRFSSTERGTPVVGEGNGEERDTDQSAAAAQSDPAPADLDEEYHNRLLAYEAGKAAKAGGWRRSSELSLSFDKPGGERAVIVIATVKWGELLFNDEQLAAAWEAGWLGEPLD